MFVYFYFLFSISLNIHIVLAYCGIFNSLRFNYSQHSRSGAFRTRTGRCAAGVGLVMWSADVAATGPGVAVAVDLLDLGVAEAWDPDKGCW